MHGARANLVKTCNRQSVTTAPSFGLVQYCWQAMGILHLPKISQTSALPEIIASYQDCSQTFSTSVAPIPTQYSTKNSNSVVKKANERWTMGKETSLSPSHCPPRAFFLSLSSPLRHKERERESQYPDNKLPLALTSLHRNGLEFIQKFAFLLAVFHSFVPLFYSFQDGFILIKETCCPCFRRRQYSQIP